MLVCGCFHDGQVSYGAHKCCGLRVTTGVFFVSVAASLKRLVPVCGMMTESLFHCAQSIQCIKTFRGTCIPRMNCMYHEKF